MGLSPAGRSNAGSGRGASERSREHDRGSDSLIQLVPWGPFWGPFPRSFWVLEGFLAVLLVVAAVPATVVELELYQRVALIKRFPGA